MKVVFYIALLSVFFSCKKEDDCDTEKTFYVDDELKSYMLHPVGSYWVYQDSVSGELDTVKINSRIEEFNSFSAESCFRKEVILDKMSSSKKGNKFNAVFQFFLSLEEIDENEGEDKENVYWEGGSKNVFFPSSIKGAKSYNGSVVETEYLEFLLEIKLNGKVYQSVKKFKNVINDNVNSELYNVLYIAKGIGYIRKEYSNGEVWDLIDYKVD